MKDLLTKKYRALAGVLGILFLVCPITSHANDTAAAQAFVKQVGDNAVSIAANESMPVKEKEQKLVTLFLEVVDTNWIGKFALGKYWKVATPEQQKKYLSLYRKFLVGSYVPKFKQYTNEILNITGVQDEGEGEFLVKTEIIRQSEAPIAVDYKVRKSGGSFKIVDIIAEGVSLVATQRSEFGAVVSREGMDAFLNQLAENIEKLALERPYLVGALS